MYIKTETIQRKIRNFCVDTNEILFMTGMGDLKNRELILWQNGIEKKIIGSGKPYLQHIRKSKHYFWVNFLSKGRSLRINKKDFSIDDSPGTFFFEDEKNNIFGSCYYNDKEKKSGLCYYEENNLEEMLWIKSYQMLVLLNSPKYIFGIPVYAKPHHILHCLDKKTGELLWQHEEDLGMPIEELKNYKPSRIKKLIGIYKETLFLGIHQNHILSLDIHTGKIKHKWEDLKAIEFFRGENIERPLLAENTLLDQEEGKIIGISYGIQWEIDLESKAFQYWDINEVFKKYKVGFGITFNTVKKDDHIYFLSEESSKSRGGLYYGVGAYNCKTRDVDWLHDFHDEKVNLWGSPQPVLHGDKVYVLDHEGTLHIFEKEHKKA